MFASGVDSSATETKGTVLIHTAEQVYQNDYNFFFSVLLDYSIYSLSKCGKFICI